MEAPPLWLLTTERSQPNRSIPTKKNPEIRVNQKSREFRQTHIAQDPNIKTRQGGDGGGGRSPNRMEPGAEPSRDLPPQGGQIPELD